MTRMRQLFTGLLLMGVFILHAQSEPLSLEDCVNMALEKNINIKQSELDVQNAGIDKLNAFGNFLPTFGTTV